MWAVQGDSCSLVYSAQSLLGTVTDIGPGPGPRMSRVYALSILTMQTSGVIASMVTRPLCVIRPTL